MDWGLVVSQVVSFAGQVLPGLIENKKNKMLIPSGGGYMAPEPTLFELEVAKAMEAGAKRQAELNALLGTNWNVRFWQKYLDTKKVGKELGNMAKMWLSEAGMLPSMGMRGLEDIPDCTLYFDMETITGYLGIKTSSKTTGSKVIDDVNKKLDESLPAPAITKPLLLIGGVVGVIYFIMKQKKK